MLIVFVIFGLFPFTNAFYKPNETEYWALLVGVGIYAGHPEEDRPSMIRDAEKFYTLLYRSKNWKWDHIRILRGEECTAINIVNSLLWLSEKEDSNDVCLIYISTHGIKGPNIFPFDEADGKDEYLATYWGFQYPITCLWDDELRFIMRLFESKNIAIIIDSCHSGGFVDLAMENRVIITACAEDELAYGSYFADYIMEGLEGKADVNNNGWVSIEEAFYYAEPRILQIAEKWGISWHPQIFDRYEGELEILEYR